MAKSIEIQILERIKKAGSGVLFFAESFLPMESGNGKDYRAQSIKISDVGFIFKLLNEYELSQNPTKSPHHEK